MAPDNRRLLRAPVWLTREVDTERLHRKIGVALEKPLPECDLRISTQVGILRTIGDKLKKTSAHTVLYYLHSIFFSKRLRCRKWIQTILQQEVVDTMVTFRLLDGSDLILNVLDILNLGAYDRKHSVE